MKALVAVAALVLAAGCTLDPRYLRPGLPTEAVWPDDTMLAGRPVELPLPRSEAAAAATAAADIGWRDVFADPVLQRLIETALANNRDARIAAINVAVARAQYRIQRADLFPAINLTAEDSVQRIPGGVIGSQFGAVGSGSGSGTGSGGGSGSSGGTTSGNPVLVVPDRVITRTYAVTVGFTSYELDVFGRVRSLSRSALEQYFGYEETQRSAVISLVAEVAQAYLALRADQQLLQLTRDTLASQRRSLAIIRRTVEGGTERLLTQRQAETQVETAAANLAAYTQRVAQDRHALSTLIGTPLPADLDAGAGLDEQQLLEELPAGLPSDLLARRPDILAAEHNLLAANASIGAARAAFFPSISLTASAGTSSTQLSGLFDSGSRTWSFLPQINLPIFAGGANLANLEVARQQKNLQIARYEQAIQNAFQEVADALSSRGTLLEQQQAQTRLQVAAADYYRLARLRYDAGVDNYLSTLDAQRSDYAAQQQLVNVKLARLQNLVTLYKALGGGWRADSVAAAAR